MDVQEEKKLDKNRTNALQRMNYITITYTNCTVETGGGKVPTRLRHNQNVKIVTSRTKEELNSFNREQLIWIFDNYCNYRQIKAKTTISTKIKI